MGKKRKGARDRHADEAPTIIRGKKAWPSWEATEHFGVSFSTLCQWANIQKVPRKNPDGKIERKFCGCLWLGGKAIDHEKVRAAYGPKVIYFFEDDRDRVHEAKCQRLGAPKYDGLTHIDEAMSRLRVGLKTLRRMLARWDPQAKIERKHGPGKDKRIRRYGYVPAAFVEEAEAARRQDPVPPHLMTREDAAKALKVTPEMISYLIGKGTLWSEEGHKTVNADPRNGEGRPLRYNVPARLVYRSDVERLQRERGIVPTTTGATPTTQAPPAPLPDEAPQPTRRGPGRPVGWTDQRAKKRNSDILEDAEAGKYPSIAALARAHGLSPSRVSHILADAGVTFRSCV
jgi:hypothetical protein